MLVPVGSKVGMFGNGIVEVFWRGRRSVDVTCGGWRGITRICY